MPLPPKNTNVMLQIICAYLQVMLWKSADKTSPPSESHVWMVLQRWCSNSTNISRPNSPRAFIRHHQVKLCSCHKVGMLCTPYCSCEGAANYKNPHTVTTQRIEPMEICVVPEVEVEDSEMESGRRWQLK